MKSRIKGSGSKYDHIAPEGKKKKVYRQVNRKFRKSGKPSVLMAEYRKKGAEEIEIPVVSVGYLT